MEEDLAFQVIADCGRSILKVAQLYPRTTKRQDTMMCDILNVSIRNIKTKAWEQKMKRHIRLLARGENKIVIDESVGEVIYVQTRYIDMQKRVGWALAHLCPSQHAQHACHFFFAAAHGLHVRVHTH